NNDSTSPNFNTPNFATWEGFWINNALPYEQTNRLFFRSATNAANLGLGYTSTSPQGFFIDDLTYSSYNSSNPNNILASFDSNSFEFVPEPAAITTMLAGALVIASRRRSR